jgi:hypothetical protein
MINNGRNDGRQLYLTAHHCVAGTDVSKHLLMFNFETLTCRGPHDEAPRFMTAQGLNLIGSLIYRIIYSYHVASEMASIGFCLVGG